MSQFTQTIPCLSLLVLLFSAACAAPASKDVPTQSQPNQVATYNEPFAYCAAVGTVDSPDARYTGPKLPDSVIQSLIAKGVVSADAPADFQNNATWRCMQDHVWACHFGANLPCMDKADTSKAPASGMEDFCKANPNADNIPAAVTGRATVYEWKCNAGKPEVIRQVFQVDAQGYLAEFWYDLGSK